MEPGCGCDDERGDDGQEMIGRQDLLMVNGTRCREWVSSSAAREGLQSQLPRCHLSKRFWDNIQAPEHKRLYVLLDSSQYISTQFPLDYSMFTLEDWGRGAYLYWPSTRATAYTRTVRSSFFRCSFLITSDATLCPLSFIARWGYRAYDLHHLSQLFAAFLMTLSMSSLTWRLCHYCRGCEVSKSLNF